MKLILCLLLVAYVSAALNPGARISVSHRGIEGMRSVANGMIHNQFMDLKLIKEGDYGVIKADNIMLKPYHPPEITDITVVDGEEGNGTLVFHVKGGLLTGKFDFSVGNWQVMGYDIKSQGEMTIGIREINGKVSVKGYSSEGRPVFRVVECELKPDFKIKEIRGGKMAKIANRFKDSIAGMVGGRLGAGICAQLTQTINSFNALANQYPTMARLENKKDATILNYGMMPQGFKVWSKEEHRPIEIELYGSFITPTSKVLSNPNPLVSQFTQADDKMIYVEIADQFLKPFADVALSNVYKIKTVLYGDSVMSLQTPARIESVATKDGGYLLLGARGVLTEPISGSPLGSEEVEVKLGANINSENKIEMQVLDIELPGDLVEKEELEQMKEDVNGFMKKSTIPLPMQGVTMVKSEIRFFKHVIRMETDLYTRQ